MIWGARSTSANYDFGQLFFSSSANSTSANFDFGQFRLRPISTSANFDLGQFRLGPISTWANFDLGQFLDVEFWDDNGWGPEGWTPEGNVIEKRHHSVIWALPLDCLQSWMLAKGKEEWHEGISLLPSLTLVNGVDPPAIIFPEIH